MTTANTRTAEKIGVLCQKLKEMRMSGMAAELEKQAKERHGSRTPSASTLFANSKPFAMSRPAIFSMR